MSKYPRVGDRQHAREALKLAGRKWKRADHPEWRQLGRGAFRAVVLHIPSNVVYKVERPDREMARSFSPGELQSLIDHIYGNRIELNHVRQLRRQRWRRARIPNASGYTIDGQLVVAMEYVKGKPLHKVKQNTLPKKTRQHLRLALLELRHSARLEDIHGNNVIVEKDGTPVLIDLGSLRLRPDSTSLSFVLASFV